MKKVCYFCGKDMGMKNGNGQAGVFQSLCDGCAYRRRLDQRLPELLWAIADLRKQNGRRDLNHELVATAAVS